MDLHHDVQAGGRAGTVHEDLQTGIRKLDQRLDHVALRTWIGGLHPDRFKHLVALPEKATVVIDQPRAKGVRFVQDSGGVPACTLALIGSNQSSGWRGVWPGT